jgi:hypothetical protein
MSFDAWYKECDGIVSRRFGVGVEDLPDAPWRDYHEDGLTPSEAIECAKEDAWDDCLIPDVL